REIAREAAILLGELPQVFFDDLQEVRVADEIATGCVRVEIGRAGGDPLLEDGEVRIGGAFLLVLGRHFAGADPLDDPGPGRVAGNDLLALDQAFAVEQVIDPALDRAVLAVAAVAVSLEDRPGLPGEFLLVLAPSE